MITLIILLTMVCWRSCEFGSFDKEKSDILKRREWLLSKVTTSPQEVLDAMPGTIGAQFQGEWALYTCSMTAEAEVAHLWVETLAEMTSWV